MSGSTPLTDAERAQAGDRPGRAAIPGYDALHQLACMVVAELTGGHGRVLVGGAGGGAECVALAESSPNLNVVGVDSSPELLAALEAKVAERGLHQRVRLYPSEIAALPRFEPFDAATLLLVLHFLPDDGAKQALLADVAQHLKPGAPLVLADLFGPAWDDPWQSELRTVWVHLQRAAGLSDKEIEAGMAHVGRDVHPVTEDRLAELFAAAGFETPRPFFRALCFGGWVARRSGD